MNKHDISSIFQLDTKKIDIKTVKNIVEALIKQTFIYKHKKYENIVLSYLNEEQESKSIDNIILLLKKMGIILNEKEILKNNHEVYIFIVELIRKWLKNDNREIFINEDFINTINKKKRKKENQVYIPKIYDIKVKDYDNHMKIGYFLFPKPTDFIITVDISQSNNYSNNSRFSLKIDVKGENSKKENFQYDKYYNKEIKL